MEIRFDFETSGAEHDDPFLDAYERDLMFEQTRQSLKAGLERKLAGMTCAEHGQPPTITITGRYDLDSEQMDISYHVDTCCKMFMVRVVQALNNIN